jgi:hypothetical protein
MKNKQQDKIDLLRTALGTILDCADYTADACHPAEMVSAVLSKLALQMGRAAMEMTRKEKR